MNSDVLRVARERKGFTQSQLAEKLNSHQSIISGIERGQQELPARLLFQMCDALELHPVALFEAEAPTDSILNPAPIIVPRVSHTFLTQRQRSLGEIVHVLMDELMRMRVDLIALTVHLFDRRPVVYAGAILGQWGVTHRENVSTDDSHLRDSQGELYRSWRERREVRKPGEQCRMPDYEPAVVIDLPVDQGMVGFGFGRELPDISAWSRIVADAVSDGLALLDEVGQTATPNLAAEMAQMKGRLSSLEARMGTSESDND
jgi:transcriptional regulator with XRE-family HTH domain